MAQGKTYNKLPLRINHKAPKTNSGSCFAVFVCASVISYVAFVMSLFVPLLSSLWCLRKVAFQDCGISWAFTYIFICYCKHY